MNGQVPMPDQAAALRSGHAPSTSPPWVAVAGAKGGVGKTVLAVNLALLLARAGQRVLLADLDPGCSNVDVHLRLAPRFDLEDVATGRCPPAEALIAGPGGITLLGGRSGSNALCGGAPELLAAMLGGIDAAARSFDVVVCDTGAGIGPAVLTVVERADLVLGVTTAEPAAVTDTYALCKLLRSRGRPLPRLVVNQVRNRDEALRTAGRLGTVTQRFLGAECPLLGWLHASAEIGRSCREQRPFALQGDGAAIEDLHALCAAVRSLLPPLARRAPLPAPRRVALRPPA